MFPWFSLFRWESHANTSYIVLSSAQFSSLNFCLKCKFLHFKSFGNDFLCLSLIHPEQLDKSAHRWGCWCPSCVVSCVHAHLRASIGGRPSERQHSAYRRVSAAFLETLLFRDSDECLLLVPFHQMIHGGETAGLQSWSVHPDGGWGWPVWNTLSLVWKEAGPSGAPRGATFPVYHWAKPNSRGGLAEEKALCGVCGKEPTGLWRGCRQVWVCISDTLAGGFQVN